MSTVGNRTSQRWRQFEKLPDYQLPVSSAPDGDGSAQALDAWYANYPDQSLGPALAAGSLEVVFGTDDRVQVPDTTQPPFLWVAYLEIQAADGTSWRGTGWLASPSLVITAGHCVYLWDAAGWAAAITVTLGFGTDNDGNEVAPLGSQTSESFRSTQAWTTSQAEEWDYGAIVLPVGHQGSGRQ